MLIERAGLANAQAILDLQKLAYLQEAAIYDDDTIPPLHQTLDGMKDDLDRQVVLKAVDGERIAGSVRGYEQDGTCYVGRLIVHPECQNQGLGAALMNALEAAFPQAARFELFTGERSAKNLYFYQKLGYRPYRTQPLSDRVTLVYLEKVSLPKAGAAPTPPFSGQVSPAG